MMTMNDDDNNEQRLIFLINFQARSGSDEDRGADGVWLV